MCARQAFAATVILASLLLLSTGLGKAAQQKNAAAPVAAPAAPAPVAAEPATPVPPAVIPLADIASQATEVSTLLSNLTSSAAPSAQIETIAKTLPELSETLDAQFATTTETLGYRGSGNRGATAYARWTAS